MYVEFKILIMKQKLFLLAVFLLTFSYGFTQKAEMKGAMMNIKWDTETHVIRCSDFNVTKPLREIAAEHPVTENKLYPFTEYPDRDGKPVQKFVYTVEKDGPKYGNEPSLIQRDFGKTLSGKALLQNWAGQTASSLRPFDPTGAASPNHYIQMINSTTYVIYDKTGTQVLSGTLGDLWSPPNTENSGDPIVLYDKDADRWFLSQFGESGNKIYIAISQTNDPTGAWYTYTFTSPDFPDYLKFGVWQDGYYMTANYAQKIFAFNRDKMLAGDGTAEAVYQTFSPPQPSGFFSPMPADASDSALPDAGTPCTIFTYSDDAWGGGNIDAVNLFNASVDWGTLTMTVTNAGALATDAFDASYDPSWNDIPQPGTTQMLDGIGGALMFRAQWMKWTGYNTVVLSWGVKVSASQRGIFWCELRQDQTDNSWSIYQQGIYAPGTAYYWMSSAAMNYAGDIALCYAKSDPTDNTYMSLAYSGRKASDPLGTMTLSEVIVQAGEGAQTGINRNGDYAHTALDPDGYTFWHTGEYIKADGSAGTRIYSFRISEPDDPNNFVAQAVSTTQIDLSWDLNPNGEPALIAWSADGTFGTPVDGTTYAPGDAIPGGGIVLAYGTTPTAYSHTGLTPSTTYYYKGWSYQTGNTYSGGTLISATTLGDPENLAANAVSTSQIDLSWNLNDASDNVLVAWSADGTFGTPVDGTTYASGDAITGGGTVLYYGSATSFNHTGLNSATQYFYKAWSNLGGTNYSPGVTANATTLCGTISAFPYLEDFEGGALPTCWSYEGTAWTYENGGHNGNPAAAYSGSFNALFYNGSWTADVSKLVTSALDLSDFSDATLTFWHTQADWSGDQDELRVFYKDAAGGTWTQLAVYTNNITAWTQETITLPNLSNDYYIAFEATGQYGYGVAIDDVTIDGTTGGGVSVTDIKQENNIRIYPNPSYGNFNVTFSNEFKNANITVTDISGKIILKKAIQNKKYQNISISDASPGIYFISISYDNKHFISKLIIK